jgi:hypothetical protein
MRAMSDDGRRNATRFPTPPPKRAPEPLWSVRLNHVTWSCELRFHGETLRAGSAMRRAGELFAARGAVVVKGDAIRWAEEQRQGAERGFLEDY